MSGRSIFFIQNLRDSLVGQEEAAWLSGSNQWHLDSSLLGNRLHIGRRLEGNGHRQALRQDRSALEDDDAIVYATVKCFHAVIFVRSPS